MNRIGKFRWVICALLFFACTVNYMDRQVLGLLKPVLSKQFLWTEADYSHGDSFPGRLWVCAQERLGPLINWTR